MAVAYPSGDEDTPEESEAAPTHEDQDKHETDGGDSGEGGGGARRRRLPLPPQAAAARRFLAGGRAPGQRRATSAARTVRDQGAGVILAGLVWVWVVLPYVRGGQDEVKAVLRAKFLNQGPDGGWL
jgi:hypothetical protein